MDPKAVQRLAAALCFSVAAHVAVLSLLKVQPIGTSSSGVSTLHAWLERVGSDPQRTLEANEPPVMTDPGPEPVRSAPLPPPVEPAAVDVQPAPVPKETTVADTPPRRADPADPGIPLAADLTYYSVAALDQPPYPLGSTDLCYPQGASGEVSYLLLIDEAGTVDEASLVSVRPEGIFVGGAIEACRALKFAPGIKDGRAVRSRVRFVVGPNP